MLLPRARLTPDVPHYFCYDTSSGSGDRFAVFCYYCHVIDTLLSAYAAWSLNPSSSGRSSGGGGSSRSGGVGRVVVVVVLVVLVVVVVVVK